jgi:SAM-dependent methyltransferase
VENANYLIGLDISDDMLRAAKSPVRAAEIVAKDIHLIRGNAYLQQFKEAEFDFIYSLGMFGHGCPVTQQICEKFHSWLKPSGRLLFNTVDFAGLPLCYRVRRRTRSVIYKILPDALKFRLDQREAKSPFFGMTAKELRATMRATRFQQISVVSYECKSPLWSGRHLECAASKAA